MYLQLAQRAGGQESLPQEEFVHAGTKHGALKSFCLEKIKRKAALKAEESPAPDKAFPASLLLIQQTLTQHSSSSPHTQRQMENQRPEMYNWVFTRNTPESSQLAQHGKFL